jgi:GDP-D-mannose 3',5'-epimerase
LICSKIHLVRISLITLNVYKSNMSSLATVLITGAGGFIGGHLVNALLQEGGVRIRAVDQKSVKEWYQVFKESDNLVLNLSELSACRKAVAGVDLVYNLASDLGGMGFIELNKAACMLSVLINTHLLVAARDAGVRRYQFASSACVYNAQKQRDPNVIRLREEDAYPAMPEDGYGWEKLFGERLCRHFREDFGLETRVARYHNVYGPHGTYAGGREKAPSAICRKVIEAKMLGKKEIEIWGDGKQTRSFTFIDDCIEGTWRVMKSDFRDPINIGSSELVSINQLVDIVEKIAGVRFNRKYNLSAPKGVDGRNSDNALVREALDWEPSTRLRDGMEVTYRWIHDQMHVFAG